MMGLGWGQTLRLNAVASDPRPVGGAGCVATLSFADVIGSVYSNPPPQNINLAPGQATFLDFPANLVVTVFGQHAIVRPMVPFPGAGGQTDYVFAAELIDQGSGFSSIFQFQYPQPPNLPGSTVSFSLMGVALLQVVRV